VRKNIVCVSKRGERKKRGVSEKTPFVSARRTRHRMPQERDNIKVIGIRKGPLKKQNRPEIQSKGWGKGRKSFETGRSEKTSAFARGELRKKGAQRGNACKFL